MLNVLGLVVDLEPIQLRLLRRVVASPKLSTLDLEAGGALPVSLSLRKAPNPDGSRERLDLRPHPSTP